MDPQTKLEQQIAARFAELPQAVQNAIASSNVDVKLRSLSDSHKLHLDQWQMFENEVMLAILGFQRVEDLGANIAAHVKVTPEMARQLAIDVNAVIFEPIREELERGLEHPSAQAAEVSGVEAAGAQILNAAGAESAVESQAAPPPAVPAVQPATPPAPALDIKVTRPSESTAYKPGQASHERKNVVDDPYREPTQ